MKITNFLREVMAELKKVSWPSKKEVKTSTLVVIVLSFIAGVYIFLADTLFNNLIHQVL